MRLILSSRHPRNCVYTTETGKILYKVDKPRRFGHGIATIRKAVGTVHGVWQGDGLAPQVLVPSLPVEKSPFDDPELEEGEMEAGRSIISQDDDAPFADSDSDSGDDVEGGSSVPSTSGGALEGHFAFLAQIEFHGISSTRFHYNNLDVSVDELFRKEGRSWYGRGRVWKASDGQEYRWNLRAHSLEMVRNDGSQNPVVIFKSYHSPHNPFKKSQRASLEIADICVPILDEIIMTFVYCHKVRKDRNH